MSAGLLAVSQLRAATTPPALADDGGTGLHVLTPSDARIFSAVAERITFTGAASMPRFADTSGLQVVDTALRQLPGDVAQQVHAAMLLFQYGPPLAGMGLATFTSLGADDQDAYLARWEHSRFETPRLAFRAFKNLAMLGYYADDKTWGGIHYGGPWAPKPRRVLSVE
jgi:hypothetical protein